MVERPEFKSKTYYDVVIGSDRFHGWRCIYAGDGTLIFDHREGGEWRSPPSKPGPGWLEEAWTAFTTMAVRHASATVESQP